MNEEMEDNFSMSDARSRQSVLFYFLGPWGQEWIIHVKTLTEIEKTD